MLVSTETLLMQRTGFNFVPLVFEAIAIESTQNPEAANVMLNYLATLQDSVIGSRLLRCRVACTAKMHTNTHFAQKKQLSALLAFCHPVCLFSTACDN